MVASAGPLSYASCPEGPLGGDSRVICPRCRSNRCRRSKRRSFRDYFIGLSGVRPWRCRDCELRFFAWVVPVSYAWYAHCGLCGNFDLQRVSSDHVYEGRLPWLGRMLHLPAYRCAPCRNRFFSLFPRRRIRPLQSEGTPGQDVAPSSESVPPG